MTELEIKTCLVCGAQFNKIPKETHKKFKGKKYCSSKCYHTTQKYKKQSESAKMKIAESIRNRVVKESTKKKLKEHQKLLRENGLHPSKRPEVRRKISKTLTGRRGTCSGEKSPLWKGGKTDLGEMLRYCFKYKKWKKEVFERDDYTCAVCGARDNKKLNETVVLNADHYPVAFYRFIDEIKQKVPNDKPSQYEYALNYSDLWDIRNGRTICRSCHYKTDTIGRPSKHVRENRFLMKLDSEIHLQSVKDKIETIVDAKYVKGNIKHGGCLSDMSEEDLLKNIEEEAIDMLVYIAALKIKKNDL